MTIVVKSCRKERREEKAHSVQAPEDLCLYTVNYLINPVFPCNKTQYCAYIHRMKITGLNKRHVSLLWYYAYVKY